MRRNAAWMTTMALAMLLALSACGKSADNASDAGAASSGAVSKSETNNSNASPGDTQVITVEASNFKFEPSEIHVKKRQHVKINFKIKEGMHGFEIPDFNINLKKAGAAEFTADKAGTYQFDCSVYCGAGHGDMRGVIIVE